MAKYVRETAAANSLSVYVITKGPRDVATIQAHFSKGGRCLVNVWQETAAYEACYRAAHSMKATAPVENNRAAHELYQFQHAAAHGYGYDKLTSALSGLMVDGHVLSGHCSCIGAPKPPKGRKLFPRDFKAPRGYSLANFCSISKATGGWIYRDEWIKRAYEALGLADASGEEKNARWHDVASKAHDMETEWQASDDYESGYSDCYRDSGLKYLEAIGYRVRNVL